MVPVKEASASCRTLLFSLWVVSNSFATPMDYSLPDCSVHGIFRARILEWVALSFSRGSFWVTDQTHVSCLTGEFFTPDPPGKPRNLLEIQILSLYCRPGFPRWLSLKNPSAMKETRVWSLGQEEPLEKEMETHSSILAWKIPWMEEPGGLQSRGCKRVGLDLATKQQLQTSWIWNSHKVQQFVLIRKSAH